MKEAIIVFLLSLVVFTGRALSPHVGGLVYLQGNSGPEIVYSLTTRNSENTLETSTIKIDGGKPFLLSGYQGSW